MGCGDAQTGRLVRAGGDLHLGAGKRAFCGHIGQQRFARQRLFQTRDGKVQISLIAGKDRERQIAFAAVIQFQGQNIGDDGKTFENLGLDLILRRFPACVFDFGHDGTDNRQSAPQFGQF